MAQSSLDTVLRRICAVTEELNNEESIEEERFSEAGAPAVPQPGHQVADGQYSDDCSSDKEESDVTVSGNHVTSQQAPTNDQEELLSGGHIVVCNGMQQVSSPAGMQQLPEQTAQQAQQLQHEPLPQQLDKQLMHYQQQDIAQQLTQQYLQALHKGLLNPGPARPAADPCVHAAGKLEQQRCSKRRSSSASPTRHSRPATATGMPGISRPCSTPDAMIATPMSAQLRSVRPGAVHCAMSAVQSSTWPLVGSTNQGSRLNSTGRLTSPPKPKRYTPGPGDYSPKATRVGMPILGTDRRTFPAAGRYEGSYLEAFAKTVHSPGPIYYHDCDRCSGSSACLAAAVARPGSSGDLSRINVTRLVMTARCTHSTAGTWNKADVGSRGAVLVHTCSCSCSKYHQAATAAAEQHCIPVEGKHKHTNCSSGSNTSSAVVCSACTAAACAVPGPGNYDSTVGKDGRGLLLTQSCPAFRVPKAGKLLTGRGAPYISAEHALRENQGACSPGPVYKPGIEAVRPSSCSPTFQGRGHKHWGQIISGSRASSAVQMLGHSPVSRTSMHLWGDAPRTHFGTAPVDRWPGTFISEKHSAVANVFRYGAEPHYRPRYDQVDGHVASARLVSGQEDRFDDKWLPGSGRLQ